MRLGFIFVGQKHISILYLIFLYKTSYNLRHNFNRVLFQIENRCKRPTQRMTSTTSQYMRPETIFWGTVQQPAQECTLAIVVNLENCISAHLGQYILVRFIRILLSDSTSRKLYISLSRMGHIVSALSRLFHPRIENLEYITFKRLNQRTTNTMFQAMHPKAILQKTEEQSAQGCGFAKFVLFGIVLEGWTISLRLSNHSSVVHPVGYVLSICGPGFRSHALSRFKNCTMGFRRGYL